MRRRLVLAAATAAILLGVVGGAQAAWVNCAVNASGGFANCLALANPGAEQVKAHHAAGLPYRFQLARLSTGSIWGWWEFNDLAYHVITLPLSGSITAQVDNRGSANPAAYYVEMIP